ncbi:Peptidyl-glycine alpha-amidating monooxygenase B [Bagarius yarrelli]|uniref:Peptidyl-glycine alpha-amidating monooxygenase B n=1 Tax=Bagarius yarrelli TaxID=175774 RepID=A0A556V2I7_BAGYA|nr:Peptidyl-glycine alpha-amidating monooxygenase B [Bagarius yarrelli]
MGVLLWSMLVLALICPNHCLSVRSPLDRYKRFEESVSPESEECFQARQPFVLSNPYNFSLDIRMPGVVPTAVKKHTTPQLRKNKIHVR